MAPYAIVVKGKEEAQVSHAVDLNGWLNAGWKVKGQQEDKKPRDIMIDRAKELGLEFDSNISNANLKKLIEAKEAEMQD